MNNSTAKRIIRRIATLFTSTFISMLSFYTALRVDNVGVAVSMILISSVMVSFMLSYIITEMVD